MKLLFLTLVSTVLFFVVLCGENKKEIQLLQARYQKCRKEAGLDPNHVIKSLEEGANNKEFKCYLKCLYVDVGGLSESGELVIEKLKSLSPDLKEEVWEILFEECKDITDSDQCEMVYKVSKCLSDKENQLMN